MNWRRPFKVTASGEVLLHVPRTYEHGVPGGIEDDGPAWVMVGIVHHEPDGRWSALAAGERVTPKRRRYESRRAAVVSIFDGLPREGACCWQSLKAVREAWSAVERM